MKALLVLFAVVLKIINFGNCNELYEKGKADSLNAIGQGIVLFGINCSQLKEKEKELLKIEPEKDDDDDDGTNYYYLFKSSLSYRRGWRSGIKELVKYICEEESK